MSARDKQELGEALEAINHRIDTLRDRIDALVIGLAELRDEVRGRKRDRAA